VTTFQLLEHFSDIRHHLALELISNAKYETVRDRLDTFIESPLLHEPGTKLHHSGNCQIRPAQSLSTWPARAS